MKLIEALGILRQERQPGAPLVRVHLVTGFTPLYLQTFLEAHLLQAVPASRPQFQTGLYGDFWGNLDKLETEDAEIGVVISEWGDFEPRLGLRSLGSCAPGVHREVVAHARARAAQFLEIVGRAAQSRPVVICFPTLPFPAIDFRPFRQAGELELELRESVASLALQVARFPNVRVVSSQYLDRVSPLRERHDAKAELTAGFPYRLPHASLLAEAVTRLIQPPTTKKGLITDLDNTLWSGILGEVGVEKISWDMEHGSHIHGLYQRLLHSLAESGVLIGIASKNDSRLVEQALDRQDLVLPRNLLFPVEAHWGAKSESVGRILKVWNIAPDAVVFVDDSPTELAEVQARHPAMNCVPFPANDPNATIELFERLRDNFGKSTLSEEDKIRLASLKAAHMRIEHAGGPAAGTTPEEFLAQAEGELSFSTAKEPFDQRAFELINKTNQFNLNGKRFTDTSWRSYLRDPESILLVASYRDKYGPLGKIAVAAGKRRGTQLHIDVWVMSCRAFSRRIEHAMLREVFERTGVEQLNFDFEATPKNGPIRDFLASMFGVEPKSDSRLLRERFLQTVPKTFHRVLETVSG
jgi:FkbH-like protein